MKFILSSGKPFLDGNKRRHLNISTKETKQLDIKWSTVCKACIIIWYGEPRQLSLPSIPYSLVQHQSVAGMLSPFPPTRYTILFLG